jgi:dipeptide/tripeptide permease
MLPIFSGIGVTFGVFSALMAGLVQFSISQSPYTGMNKTDIKIWIQVPQFAFMGIGEVFTDVAGQCKQVYRHLQ